MATRAKNWAKKSVLAALVVGTAVPAMAGVQLFKDGEKVLTLGGGMRTSLDLGHGVPPSGSVWSNDISNTVDLYTDFDLTSKIGYTMNLTYGSTNAMELMDLVARFKFTDEANIWAGRLIPPDTRSNISGSYFMAPWNYPGNTDLFPYKFYGRDDGIVFWGDLGGTGKFKYFVGAFEGVRGGATNQDMSPEAIAKVTYNFMDGEPGYYHSSTYYGTKKILAVSYAGSFQSYANGDPAVDSNANLTASTLDVLYEQPFDGIGTFTVEAAGFYYDTNNYGAPQSKGSSIVLAYLLPSKKIQFYGRYESWQDIIDPAGIFPSVEDYGVQYLVDSYNTRFVLTYRNAKTTGVTTSEGVNMSAQLMF